MKALLRRIFSPLLNLFESGTEPFDYKPSARIILLVMGLIFTALAAIVLWFAWGQDPGYLLPVFIFGGIGFISLLIGLIGNDRAVAKIWGSRK